MTDLSFGVIVQNDKKQILFHKNRIAPKYSLPEEKAPSDLKVSKAVPEKIKRDSGISVDVLEFFGIRQEKGIHLIFICKAKSDIDKAKKKDFRWVEIEKSLGLDLPESSRIALEAYFEKKKL